MQEAFLQLVWQLGYFDKKGWQTAAGESIEIYHPGRLNHDSGPDFKGARLKIGELQWVGDVELHIRTSGWQQHRHQLDPAYNAVVLHVVLEDDRVPAVRREGTEVPVAALQGRIPQGLQERYQQLLESLQTIPCASQLPAVTAVSRLSMLDRVLLQRLQRKAEAVLQLLQKNNNNWEETAWQLVAQGFGFKKNTDAFAALSQRLPYKLLLHAANTAQREALLFGMSGLLPAGEQEEEWVSLLQREWNFLQHKWSLQDKALNPGQWLFSKLRPANFPTLRLAQLAALLQQQPKLFSFLLEARPEELKKAFQVVPSSYWQTHYRFGKESKTVQHALGSASAAVLLMNVVAPLKAAYASYTDNQEHLDEAANLLQSLPGEDNNIIRYWQTLEMPIATAADTQGLLELFNEYCTPKRCLQCSIGLAILKS